MCSLFCSKETRYFLKNHIFSLGFRVRGREEGTLEYWIYTWAKMSVWAFKENTTISLKLDASTWI